MALNAYDERGRGEEQADSLLGLALREVLHSVVAAVERGLDAVDRMHSLPERNRRVPRARLEVEDGPADHWHSLRQLLQPVLDRLRLEHVTKQRPGRCVGRVHCQRQEVRGWRVGSRRMGGVGTRGSWA
eukprot:2858309-Rhodomonas_salina.3